MFDVNFSEILVILVVALVVIGPERLPAVARSMGQWLGRIQRFVSTVKQDVNKSMELEELRELERKVKAEAAALEQSAQQAGKDISREMRQVEQEIERHVADPDKSSTPPNPPLPPQHP
jgi:sec-independent protein translocase protein TatB